jgi:hypothetical protein
MKSHRGPPGKERRPAANRSAKTSKKLNGTVTDSSQVVNADRELIESRAKVLLFKVTDGRRVTYVVEEGVNRWSFNMLFPAVGKFERLARKEKRP